MAGRCRRASGVTLARGSAWAWQVGGRGGFRVFGRGGRPFEVRPKRAQSPALETMTREKTSGDGGGRRLARVSGRGRRGAAGSRRLPAMAEARAQGQNRATGTGAPRPLPCGAQRTRPTKVTSHRPHHSGQRRRPGAPFRAHLKGRPARRSQGEPGHRTAGSPPGPRVDQTRDHRKGCPPPRRRAGSECARFVRVVPAPPCPGP